MIFVITARLILPYCFHAYSLYVCVHRYSLSYFLAAETYYTLDTHTSLYASSVYTATIIFLAATMQRKYFVLHSE